MAATNRQRGKKHTVNPATTVPLTAITIVGRRPRRAEMEPPLRMTGKELARLLSLHEGYPGRYIATSGRDTTLRLRGLAQLLEGAVDGLNRVIDNEAIYFLQRALMDMAVQLEAATFPWSPQDYQVHVSTPKGTSS